MRAVRAFPVLALALLAGCASLQPTPPTTVHQPMTVRPAPAPQAVPATGSIFQQAQTRPLFEDRRARHAGDTLTINLVERNTAQKAANSSGGGHVPAAAGTSEERSR